MASSSAAEISLLRALASAPSTVVEHWAGSVRIKVHIFPENSDPLRDFGNELLPGDSQVPQQSEPSSGQAAYTGDAAPERQPYGAEEAAAVLPQAGQRMVSEETRLHEPGTAAGAVAGSALPPGAGGGATIGTQVRETLDTTREKAPAANSPGNWEWSQTALALGVALVAAGLGVDWGWTRLTRRSPGTVEFWDD